MWIIFFGFFVKISMVIIISWCINFLISMGIMRVWFDSRLIVIIIKLLIWNNMAIIFILVNSSILIVVCISIILNLYVSFMWVMRVIINIIWIGLWLCFLLGNIMSVSFLGFSLKRLILILRVLDIHSHFRTLFWIIILWVYLRKQIIQVLTLYILFLINSIFFLLFTLTSHYLCIHFSFSNYLFIR